MDVQQVLDVSRPSLYFFRLVFHLHTCLHYTLSTCSPVLLSPQSINVQIDENSLHEILNEVDLNKNGQVEIDEFLQVRNTRTDIGVERENNVIISDYFCRYFTFTAAGSRVKLWCSVGYSPSKNRIFIILFFNNIFFFFILFFTFSLKLTSEMCITHLLQACLKETVFLKSRNVSKIRNSAVNFKEKVVLMLFHISWQNLPREEELITIK